MTSRYLPEGRLYYTTENRIACSSKEGLEQAMRSGTILEAEAILCDEQHNLHVRLGGFPGIIPREETALGIADGTTRDIAILSRVGKPVCFVITALKWKDGVLTPLLSRRKVQEQALSALLRLQPGTVIPATVTHLEPFGAFVDIGCGVPSMIGVERLSVSRIRHTADRLVVGDEIYAAVLGVDRSSRRILLTHRELLGTWAENAALFRQGMTVPGYVRGLKEYGAFIELTPNLSGLAEKYSGLEEDDRVSVYIKAILPERMKLKLLIIDHLPPEKRPQPIRYFHTDGVLSEWNYAPEGSSKPGGITVF